MKKIIAVCMAILLITGCSSSMQTGAKEQKNTSVTVATILDVIRVTAPDKLAGDLLQTSNKISLFLWLRDVENWTNQLLRYSQRLTLTETDKQILTESLQDYYSAEQALRIFDSYFQKGSDGTYTFKEQESFGVLASVQFALQVNLKEADGRYHIGITGKYSDSLEELMESEVEERVTVLQDTLLIDSVEPVTGTLAK
ncbi:hypothetical protein [Paenibacillus apiarius]|uniref:hypothetical protein n=1 Tax=Paenibacillus apiarius TaxID=46240 RepID=UPI00197DFDAB|nr:hypothetical protein [Paenibacillus apiarius]MBN3524499.1 hypothetical protein [Paenibacillus apiarius]